MRTESVRVLLSRHSSEISRRLNDTSKYMRIQRSSTFHNSMRHSIPRRVSMTTFSYMVLTFHGNELVDSSAYMDSGILIQRKKSLPCLAENAQDSSLHSYDSENLISSYSTSQPIISTMRHVNHSNLLSESILVLYFLSHMIATS